MRTTKALLLSILTIGFFSLNAQDNSETWKRHDYAKIKYPEGKGSENFQKDSGQHMQAAGFLDRRAKKWTVGLKGGVTGFHGDADKSKLGWNVAPYLKYSISQTFALRAEYNIGTLAASRSDDGPSMYKENFEFSSKFQDWNVQAQFTLGNISFLRPLRKTQMYLFAGLGQGSYRSEATFIDQRLTLGDYYLNSHFGTGSPNPNLGKEVTEEYEGKHLIVPFGIGFKHYLSKYFDLGLEYRMTYARTDDIDVYNTPIWENRWFDMYSMANVTIGFKFGNKNSQHYDWMNPVESIYDKMTRLDEKVTSLTSDDDGDGVPNFFDKDSNTPDSCEVYGSGKSVDTDGDGIPDCRDLEPFSPRDCEVDEYGVAIDSDGDGVPDCIDKEPNSRPGALVDRHGVEIAQCCSCEDAIFPSVYFSSSADGTIKPEYYSVLYQIAERMRTCPDKNLVISGFGTQKSSKYNSTVNTRRIDAIAKHLNEKYGISRDRIVSDYKGEKNTSTDKSNANKRIDFRFE